MPYYCGSCKNQGRVTEIPRDKVFNGYFYCATEQRRITKNLLESHRLKPRYENRQTSLEDFS